MRKVQLLAKIKEEKEDKNPKVSTRNSSIESNPSTSNRSLISQQPVQNRVEERFSTQRLLQYKKKATQQSEMIAKIKKVPAHYHKKINLKMETIKEEDIDDDMYEEINTEIYKKYGTLGGLAEFNRNMLLFEPADENV